MKIIINAAYDTDTGQLFEAAEHDRHDVRAVLTGPYTMWAEDFRDQSARHHGENATDLADATLREIAGLIYLTIDKE
jgi:methionine synthase II (cobalamin-independent)